MISAHWGIWAVNHWYEVAAEQLQALRRSGFPVLVNVHLTGNAYHAFELQQLAGWLGVPLAVTVHKENAYEFHALHALQEAMPSGPVSSNRSVSGL